MVPCHLLNANVATRSKERGRWRSLVCQSGLFPSELCSPWDETQRRLVAGGEAPFASVVVPGIGVGAGARDILMPSWTHQNYLVDPVKLPQGKHIGKGWGWPAAQGVFSCLILFLFGGLEGTLRTDQPIIKQIPKKKKLPDCGRRQWLWGGGVLVLWPENFTSWPRWVMGGKWGKWKDNKGVISMDWAPFNIGLGRYAHLKRVTWKICISDAKGENALEERQNMRKYVPKYAKMWATLKRWLETLYLNTLAFTLQKMIPIWIRKSCWSF